MNPDVIWGDLFIVITSLKIILQNDVAGLAIIRRYRNKVKVDECLCCLNHRGNTDIVTSEPIEAENYYRVSSWAS